MSATADRRDGVVDAALDPALQALLDDVPVGTPDFWELGPDGARAAMGERIDVGEPAGGRRGAARHPRSPRRRAVAALPSGLGALGGARGVLPRRRLDGWLGRGVGPPAAAPGLRQRRDDPQRRLPPGARAPVPGCARRQRGRDRVGGRRARPIRDRRPLRRRRRRQRGRQPRRRRRPTPARPRWSPPRPPAADLPGRGAPLRLRLLRAVGGGLLPHQGDDAVVLGPLRRRGDAAVRRPPGRCRSRRPAAHHRAHVHPRSTLLGG